MTRRELFQALGLAGVSVQAVRAEAPIGREDVIVVECSECVTPETAAQVKWQVRQALGRDVAVLVTDARAIVQVWRDVKHVHI